MGALSVTGKTTDAGRLRNASMVQYTPAKLANAAMVPYNNASK